MRFPVGGEFRRVTEHASLMPDAERFVCDDGGYAVHLPASWSVQPDSEGRHWKLLSDGRVLARIATWDCTPQDNAKRLWSAT